MECQMNQQLLKSVMVRDVVKCRNLVTYLVSESLLKKRTEPCRISENIK